MNRIILFTITFCLLYFKSFAQNDISKTNSSNGLDQKKSKLLQQQSSLEKIKDQKNIPATDAKGDPLSNLFKQQAIVSLMFDDEELGEINLALQSLKTGDTYDPNKKKENAAEDAVKKNQENEKSYIYLASIMYYSAKEWAVWINNTKITSETNASNKELFVRSIDRDFAKIRWSLSLSKWKILSGKDSAESTPPVNASGQVEINFTLKPNQTFVLSSNRIIEGRAVASANSAKAKKNKPL